MPQSESSISVLLEELRHFDAFGSGSVEEREVLPEGGAAIPRFVNEFWTSRQRQANSLHELSYRACFKPQLPRFFIDRLTNAGDIVYDPFMGRGTTPLEAALCGRIPWGADINPLSAIMLAPRLCPPPLDAVEERLASLDLESPAHSESEELLTFFHPATLRAICRLREYLLGKGDAVDAVDAWIRMVALNRLTGHSSGFFSVYTLPPNQATSVKAQQRINSKRGQVPPLRDVRSIIMRKSRTLLSSFKDSADTLELLRESGSKARLVSAGAEGLPPLPAGKVKLVVTSPPFLDVVDYAGDNWMRGWFCGMDTAKVPITMLRKQEQWEAFVERSLGVMKELLSESGHIAFEVGEVRKGSVPLEKSVLAAGQRAGLRPELVLINSQDFTKTANCWGVSNNSGGTNTNRIVLFSKKG
ncbi:MAG: hypothetical protein JW942_08220 [Opitutales bacterium]|nr:hypothetical protein [Opitutales bacterium]